MAEYSKKYTEKDGFESKSMVLSLIVVVAVVLIAIPGFNLNRIGDFLGAIAIGFAIWFIGYKILRGVYSTFLKSTRNKFSCDPREPIFKSDGLSIRVDKDKAQVQVNIYQNHYVMDVLELGIYVEDITEYIPGGSTYSSGTSYASNGQAVTVYVPTGYSDGVSSRTGECNIEITRYAGGDRSKAERLMYIKRNSDFALAVSSIAHSIEEIKKAKHQIMAREKVKEMVKEAGLKEDSNIMFNQNGGVVTELLAADSNGNGMAIYNNGADEWRGSWKSAEAVIADKDLYKGIEVRVDDPEYRKQHLAERRFTVFKNADKARLTEWKERIAISSAM